MAATYQVNLSESLKVLWLCSKSDPSQVDSKQFIKQWVVLSSHLPGEGSLHFYTSKSAVLHDPAVTMERLSDMNDVCHLGYSKKQLILQLSYTDHSILLQFSSASTMKLWQEKLKAFLYCYPLFLLKCPHKPYETGYYIVSYGDNTLSVFSTKSNELAWRWNIGHLRRYCYEPKVPFVEIEAGRSSETGEGKFFFSGNRCRQLYNLLESLSFNARSPKRYISSTSNLNNAKVTTGFPRSVSNSIDISRSTEDIRSKSVDVTRADDIPRTDSAGYLTVLCPAGVSPSANRKFFMQKSNSLSSNTSNRINGDSTTAATAVDSHRNRHPFSPSASLDEHMLCHKNRVINEPRSHSIPDVKETLKNGTFLQDISNSQRKTPYINVAGMDFDAFDNYSDDDDDGYVNDDEKKAAVSSIKTHQN